ncbi:MAG: hypothetical protein ACRDOI_18985 [Trebonia sp.]
MILSTSEAADILGVSGLHARATARGGKSPWCGLQAQHVEPPTPITAEQIETAKE